MLLSTCAQGPTPPTFYFWLEPAGARWRDLRTLVDSPTANSRRPARLPRPAGEFCAGFDFTLFGTPAMDAILDSRGELLAQLAALLENGSKPTVAALEGAALGGGLEIAMACNARVAAEGAPQGSLQHRGCCRCAQQRGLRLLAALLLRAEKQGCKHVAPARRPHSASHQASLPLPRCALTCNWPCTPRLRPRTHIRMAALPLQVRSWACPKSGWACCPAWAARSACHALSAYRRWDGGAPGGLLQPTLGPRHQPAAAPLAKHWHFGPLSVVQRAALPAKTFSDALPCQPCCSRAAQALNLMMSGQPIPAEDGLAIGLVDRVVPQSQLLAAAKAAALELAAGAVPRRRSLQLSQHMQQSGDGFVEAVAAVAEAQARVNRGLAGQRHYLLLLEAVAAGLAQGAPAGLQQVRGQLPAACTAGARRRPGRVHRQLLACLPGGLSTHELATRCRVQRPAACLRRAGGRGISLLLRVAAAPPAAGYVQAQPAAQVGTRARLGAAAGKHGPGRALSCGHGSWEQRRSGARGRRHAAALLAAQVSRRAAPSRPAGPSVPGLGVGVAVRALDLRLDILHGGSHEAQQACRAGGPARAVCCKGRAAVLVGGSTPTALCSLTAAQVGYDKARKRSSDRAAAGSGAAGGGGRAAASTRKKK